MWDWRQVGGRISASGMQRQAKQNRPAARKNGQRAHHWAHNGKAVPRIFCEAKTAVNIGLRQLFKPTDSLLSGAKKLFGHRVKPDTIKKWRQGKRKTPAWALALVRAAIERRIAELQHARELLG